MNTPVINSAAPPTEVVGHASPVAISVAYNGAITNDAGLDLRYRTKKVLIENDFVSFEGVIIYKKKYLILYSMFVKLYVNMVLLFKIN
ncbi:hypothetical protein TNCT_541411 [Trichonephila clavata]|uniref:Uncharacterized protein n=1 Tax=Trichonephila clavata TaxID=2740835 RepID=A0A8X6KYZ8_TRICU|nr:hypothetical protein TNCT_541411 [Trichonephila clavata]